MGISQDSARDPTPSPAPEIATYATVKSEAPSPDTTLAQFPPPWLGGPTYTTVVYMLPPLCGGRGRPRLCGGVRQAGRAAHTAPGVTVFRGRAGRCDLGLRARAGQTGGRGRVLYELRGPAGRPATAAVGAPSCPAAASGVPSTSARSAAFGPKGPGPGVSSVLCGSMFLLTVCVNRVRACQRTSKIC